jgi:hypothetical protein
MWVISGLKRTTGMFCSYWALCILYWVCHCSADWITRPLEKEQNALQRLLHYAGPFMHKQSTNHRQVTYQVTRGYIYTGPSQSIPSHHSRFLHSSCSFSMSQCWASRLHHNQARSGMWTVISCTLLRSGPALWLANSCTTTKKVICSDSKLLLIMVSEPL